MAIVVSAVGSDQDHDKYMYHNLIRVKRLDRSPARPMIPRQQYVFANNGKLSCIEVADKNLRSLPSRPPLSVPKARSFEGKTTREEKEIKKDRDSMHNIRTTKA